MLVVEQHGNGPPLLLLHGWAMHAGIFAASVADLSTHYTVHAIDLPGHGRANQHSFDLAQTRAALAAYLKQLDQKAHLIGWSMGGALAAQLALDCSAQTQSLMAIASSARFLVDVDWPHAMALSMFEKFAADLQADWRGVVDRFLALEVLGSAHEQTELRFLREQVYLHGAPHISALHQGLQALQQIDLRAQLSALCDIPSIWIAGRRDRICAPLAVSASAQLAGGRYVQLPSAHAPFLSDPGLIRRLLDASQDRSIS